MKTVLTIAGSDSSGGAGIQADLKTMIMNGVFGMSAVTALTAQNTIGVSGILAVDGDFLRRQIDAVFEDIRPDAVKIGMAVSKELIQVAAERLLFYRADHVVVDPVMISTSGSRLLQPDAVEELTRRLFPLAQLVTPNIPEAELLSGRTIADRNDMELAAEYIGKAYGCAVLLKGGHSVQDATIFCMQTEGQSGLLESGSTHPIPTERAAPCQAPSLPTCPRAFPSGNR